MDTSIDETMKMTSLEVKTLSRSLKNLIQLKKDSNVDVARQANQAFDKLNYSFLHVTSLSISCPLMVKELHVFSLSMLTSLQELHLDACPPSTIQHLSDLRVRLRYLNVTNAGIPALKKDLLPEAALASLPSLYPMSLPSVKRPVVTETYKWKLLEECELINCGITSLDQSLHFLPTVRRLDVSYNDIAYIVHLQDCINLSALNISHNRIRVLSNLELVLGNILQLNLSHNNVVSLDGLEKLYSLEMLDISNNVISDVNEVDCISRLPCLESVDMVGNPFMLTHDPKVYRLCIFRLFVYGGACAAAHQGPGSNGHNRRLIPMLDGVGISDEEAYSLRGDMFQNVTVDQKECSHVSSRVCDPTVGKDMCSTSTAVKEDPVPVVDDPLPSTPTDSPGHSLQPSLLSTSSPLTTSIVERIRRRRQYLDTLPYPNTGMDDKVPTDAAVASPRGNKDGFPEDPYSSTPLYDTGSVLALSTELMNTLHKRQDDVEHNVHRKLAVVYESERHLEFGWPSVSEVKEVLHRQKLKALHAIDTEEAFRRRELDKVISVDTSTHHSNRHRHARKLSRQRSRASYSAVPVHRRGEAQCLISRAAVDYDCSSESSEHSSDTGSCDSGCSSDRSSRCVSTDVTPEHFEDVEGSAYNRESIRTGSSLTLGGGDLLHEDLGVATSSCSQHSDKNKHDLLTSMVNGAVTCDPTTDLSLHSTLSQLSLQDHLTGEYDRTDRTDSFASVSLDETDFVSRESMVLGYYCGHKNYAEFSVFDNIELYLQEQVFNANRREDCSPYLQLDASLSCAYSALNHTSGSSGSHELIGTVLRSVVSSTEVISVVYMEDVLDMQADRTSAPSADKERPACRPDNQCFGIAPKKRSQESSELSMIIVVTDVNVYFIHKYFVGHATAVFSDSPLLSVFAIHPLRALCKCSIYFGFQRCALEFSVHMPNQHSSSVSKKMRRIYHGSGSYLVVPREKARTYELTTRLPQLANVHRQKSIGGDAHGASNASDGPPCGIVSYAAPQPKVSIVHVGSEIERTVTNYVDKHMPKSSNVSHQMLPNQVLLYQMLFLLPSSKSAKSSSVDTGNSMGLARTLLLTPVLLLLTEESLDCSHVNLAIQDSCSYRHISLIQPDANPCMVTIHIKKRSKPLLGMASGTRKWRLRCHQSTAVVRLIEEIRRLSKENNNLYMK